MKFKFISLGFIILVLQLYLFLRADFIFGSDAPAVKEQILAILVLLSLSLASLGVKLPTLKTGVADLWKFSIVFIITSIIFVLIPSSVVKGLIGSTLTITLGYGILYSMVFAYSEEVVFRGIFPKFAGDIISTILFGLFHYGIGGYSISSLLILMIFLAIPCIIIRNKIGLMGAVGYHFAWNMAAMGILPLIMQGLFGIVMV